MCGQANFPSGALHSQSSLHSLTKCLHPLKKYKILHPLLWTTYKIQMVHPLSQHPKCSKNVCFICHELHFTSFVASIIVVCLWGHGWSVKGDRCAPCKHLNVAIMPRLLAYHMILYLVYVMWDVRVYHMTMWYAILFGHVVCFWPCVVLFQTTENFNLGYSKVRHDYIHGIERKANVCGTWVILHSWSMITTPYTIIWLFLIIEYHLFIF